MIRVERKYTGSELDGLRGHRIQAVIGTFTNIIRYGLLVQARCINGENAEVAVYTQLSELTVAAPFGYTYESDNFRHVHGRAPQRVSHTSSL